MLAKLFTKSLRLPTAKFLHRSSSSYLINHADYGFLKELGIEQDNNGVYNGKWSGSGEVSFRIFVDNSLRVGVFIVTFYVLKFQRA